MLRPRSCEETPLLRLLDAAAWRWVCFEWPWSQPSWGMASCSWFQQPAPLPMVPRRDLFPGNWMSLLHESFGSRPHHPTLLPCMS